MPNQRGVSPAIYTEEALLDQEIIPIDHPFQVQNVIEQSATEGLDMMFLRSQFILTLLTDPFPRILYLSVINNQIT